MRLNVIFGMKLARLFVMELIKPLVHAEIKTLNSVLRVSAVERFVLYQLNQVLCGMGPL